MKPHPLNMELYCFFHQCSNLFKRARRRNASLETGHTRCTAFRAGFIDHRIFHFNPAVLDCSQGFLDGENPMDAPRQSPYQI